jgi:hypothetical protein
MGVSSQYLTKYLELESRFNSSTGTGVPVPAAKSFFSGRCFSKDEQDLPLIGGIYWDNNPDQYATIIFQRPTANYPVDYGDSIRSEDDAKLRWLLMNNNSWGAYFYETAEFKPDMTSLVSNNNAYVYLIKETSAGEYLVKFANHGDFDPEEDPNNTTYVDGYCQLVKNFGT